MDIMSPGLNIAGPQCPIVVNSGSTPTSLVWKGLTEFITIGQTQTFSRIAIRGCSLNISKNVFAIVFVFVFVVVFLLGQVMFSHHSDQIKCLKGQKSQRLLFGDVFSKCICHCLDGDPHLGADFKFHCCYYSTKSQSRLSRRIRLDTFVI